VASDFVAEVDAPSSSAAAAASAAARTPSLKIVAPAYRVEREGGAAVFVCSAVLGRANHSGAASAASAASASSAGSAAAELDLTWWRDGRPLDK